MDGAEWLRTQLEAYACASCGRTYVASHIRVLAQREDLFFVDLACEGCGAEAVAIVTIETESAEGEQVQTSDLGTRRRRRRRSPGRGVKEQSPPVTVDDVLSMHLFLRDFDGDFRRLFRDGPGTPTRSPEAE